MRSQLIGAGIAALILSVSACTTTSSPTSGSTGSGAGASASTLTVAIGTDIDSLDPAAQATTAVMQQVAMMVETLTRIDTNGQPKPLLATSWKVSSDGRSYTFTIRSGVKFSDGTPLTAAAVKWSLDRINSPKTYKADPNVFTVIKSVDTVGANQVRINLQKAFPALPAALSLPIAGITSPTAASKAPNTLAQIKQPVGTGPYVFSSEAAGDHLTMKANPNYWGPKPTYAEQTYKVVPDASSRLALLQSGGADIIADPPPNNIQSLQSNSQDKVLLFDSPYVIQMQFNTQDPKVAAMRNPAVRRALSYAVDRAAIIKSVLFGAGSQLKGPLPSFIAGSCATGQYDYNPNKAKQLLAQAGASNLSLQMMAPNGRYLNDYKVAQAVAGYLRAVGVKVTLAPPTDFATYLSQVNVTPSKSTNRDLDMIGWGALYPDASQALFQFHSSDLPPTGYDGSNYTNPSYDKLVDKGNADPNNASRNAEYCQAQKILFKDAPVMWLYGLKNVVVTSNRVSGVVGLPNNTFDTVYAKPTS